MNPIRNENELGQAVRVIRRSRGLTQTELAAKAQVSRAFLISFERGTAPRAEIGRAFRVLRVLGMQLELTAEKPFDFADALHQLIQRNQEHG
jgi:transcriptional regulator with XRE-family HTH domain